MKRLWTILPLLFVFSCDDQQESENMYQYSGYDSLGVQIIEGSFFLNMVILAQFLVHGILM